MLVSNLDSSFWVWLLHFSRGCFMDELGSMLTHIVSDSVSHILIKSSKEDRSNHDSGIIPKGTSETWAFKSNVWGTNNECFTWCFLKWEDIITGDTEFFVTWNSWIWWSSTNCDHNSFSSHLWDISLSIIKINSMSIFKSSIFVEVLDLKLNHISFVSPIKSLDMHLDLIDHLVPVVFLIHIWCPSTQFLICPCFRKKSGIMHHFLGYATNIYACTTKAPFRSWWSWLNKIS